MPDDHEQRLPDLDGVTFTSVANSEGGDVDGRTTFVYQQSGDEVWAEYSGGVITRGFLVGIRIGDRLSFRYVHLSIDGLTSTGRCESVITLDGEGCLVLDETWEWVVASEPDAEHCCLLLGRRMEVLVAGSGLRCMKCRVEQLDTRSRLQRVGADPRHGLVDHERFGECQEPHWARRSRIS